VVAANLSEAANLLEEAIKKSRFETLPQLLPPVKLLLTKVIENLEELVTT